jgi:flagellar biosynthesis GTPase FlhF
MLDFAYVCPIEAYDLATPRLIAQDLRRVISTVFRCSRLRLLDCPLYRLLFSVASIWPRTTSTTVTATILSAASTIKSTTKRKAEEEVRKKAEEEARKKAEEEAKREDAEEAKCKAEEERKAEEKRKEEAKKTESLRLSREMANQEAASRRQQG